MCPKRQAKLGLTTKRRSKGAPMSSIKQGRFTVQVGVALAALSALAATCRSAEAQTNTSPITVTKDGGTDRALPIPFYGVNGQQRGFVAWAQNGVSAFTSALNGLNLGVLRFPGGTSSQFWDWSNFTLPLFFGGGDFIGSFYYGNPPSQFQSPLSELQSELADASQSSGPPTAPLFVLNVLTDPAVIKNTNPTCQSNPSSCTPSPNSPDLAYQLLMLQTASNPTCLSGMSCQALAIPYVELGNEFYFANPCFVDVYPDLMVTPTPATDATATEGSTITQPIDTAGLQYANLLVGNNGSTNWVTQIKSTDPGAQVAAVAVDIADNTAARIVDWNSTFLSAPIIPPVDALTLHIYRPTNLGNLETVSRWS
jgi:hypothetical protein